MQTPDSPSLTWMIRKRAVPYGQERKEDPAVVPIEITGETMSRIQLTVLQKRSSGKRIPKAGGYRTKMALIQRTSGN